VESLKRVEAESRRLAEEARIEREQRRAIEEDFNKLRLTLESHQAYGTKLSALFDSMTAHFDRAMFWYDAAQETLNDLYTTLRAAQIEPNDPNQTPLARLPGQPVSPEDAVRNAEWLLAEYRRKRVGEISKLLEPPST
jgi:sulfate adenylyltransferase subunit 1 (EFTu-like GTPase family)